jgi:hypothetical protein
LPNAVTDDTLAAFERYLTGRYLHPNMRHTIGNHAKGWRRMTRLGLVEVSSTLSAPNRRQAYTRPFTDYPESFQADVARFAQRLAGGSHNGPYRGDGPARAQAAGSIKGRLFSLRQAAAALVLHDRDPATLLGLVDLVEPQAFDVILRHF